MELLVYVPDTMEVISIFHPSDETRKELEEEGFFGKNGGYADMYQYSRFNLYGKRNSFRLVDASPDADSTAGAVVETILLHQPFTEMFESAQEVALHAVCSIYGLSYNFIILNFYGD